MSVLLGRAREDGRRLIEATFADGANIPAECPLVFDEGFDGELVGLEHEGVVRAACGILPREFETRGETIAIGLIGSVVTDEAFRGRGLGTRLLVAAEEHLRARGCELALLWADDADFYLHRGYDPIGGEDDFELGATAARALPDVDGVRSCTPADATAIHGLYERHPVRVRRSGRETAALLACPGMTTLVAVVEGEVRAYACCGRGRDLAGVVHEWAGPTELVAALVKRHHARAVGAGAEHLVVMTPGRTAELGTRLEAAGARRNTGYLGLAKALSLDGLTRLFDRRLSAQGSAELSAEDSPTIRFHGPSGEGTFDAREALTFLFPPGAIRAEVEALAEGLGLAPGALPLDLFAFGLDSI